MAKSAIAQSVELEHDVYPMTMQSPAVSGGSGGGKGGDGGCGGDGGSEGGGGGEAGSGGGCGGSGGSCGGSGGNRKQSLQPERVLPPSDLHVMRPSPGTMPAGPLVPQYLLPLIVT